MVMSSSLPLTLMSPIGLDSIVVSWSIVARE